MVSRQTFRDRSLIGLVVVGLLLLGGDAVPRTSAATTAPAAPTVTAMLSPTDDGYVDSRRPAKAFGTVDNLQVGMRPLLRSYLKFDLSSLDGTVTGAVLKLTATSASKAGFTVREVADSAWSARTLRYANAPAFSRPVGVGARAFAARQVLSLDVTGSVRAGIRSFALVDRGGPIGLSVASSESGRLLARPRLVVTYAAANASVPCGIVPAPPRKIDHVIWIWMENKPFEEIIGSPLAPYENHLAAACGLATNYHGVTHPSLPNYIAATSGGTQGIADDEPPSSHPLGTESIYDQIKAVGKTWRNYQESAPGNCSLTSSGLYAVKHDPAPYYTRIRSDCTAWDVPMGTTESGNFLADLTGGSLPAFSYITPNMCNDTHDCPVRTGDAWLESWFAKILISPTYLEGRTVVILTWDEDRGTAPNSIPTIVVSPSTPAGTRSGTSLNHYSLLKTTEQLLGIKTFLGHAGDPGTSSMVSDFNLGPG